MGPQMESGAAQAVSSVAPRREAERMARKKEEDVWRRSETGVQLRMVELERKLVKKDGQEGAVKLLPTEVSNGEGSGVVMTVTEAMESEDVVGVSVFMVEDTDVDAEDGCKHADVGAAGPDADLVDSRSSCLRSRGPEGGDLVSTCISPLNSSSLKCAESSARDATGASYADAQETIATSSVSSNRLTESGLIGRLLPGRGLCGEVYMAKVRLPSSVRLRLPSIRQW